MYGWPEPYIYGVYTVFWQGNYHIYGHIQCIYTVLANPSCVYTLLVVVYAQRPVLRALQ